ncbi:MAG: MBL fold metallo-hydrolase [Chitinophagaceae bacterium]|nr:MBL fold metallo-hydrolase [Chitinophagaceae bacterium]
MANIDSITVRMYNTGSVGDCLLLLFKKNNVVTFTTLIDCGGFNTNTQSITACANDIRQTIGAGNPIDLVIVTHEHLDHVSGFNQAKAVYDSIPFNQVWMAWTENPTDPIAKKLKKTLGKKLQALIATLTEQHKKVGARLKSSTNTPGLNKRLKHYSKSWGEVLDALHFENGRSLQKNLAAGLTVSNAMVCVKGKSIKKSKEEMFRKPGEVIRDIKGAEGIKFHILGPPYDEDLSGIKNKMQEDEMYSLQKHAAFASSQTFLNAVGAGSSTPAFSKSPFSEKYKMDAPEEKDFFKKYHSKDMAWRQIEEDWLETSEQLAIAINTYTNNTSLAMAIEFEGSGKVMLFPADAQSGNWISWHNESVTSALKRNGGKPANELLDKTVFYKVGHHGSHNGTASKSGLDKMGNSRQLVAMMPLVQDKVPSQWGGSKNFPAKALYTELIKKTNGAILRTDEGLIKDPRAKELREKNLSALMQKKLKAASKPLYQEWTVEG